MAPARFGRYAVIDTIGSGAMGVVYRAADPRLDRQVAIKTIRLDGVDADVARALAARFRTEALAVGRLQHPHIVTIFDVGVEGETPYFVMELVSGQSLKSRLDRVGRLSLGDAAQALQQLLDALSFAHGRHIIHRDIKPANIFFDHEGQLKLGDFGAARIVDSGDSTLTQGCVIGTPRYMSPEQIQGQALDHRSDIFSTGVVLYQMLSGQRPFDGGSDYVVTHKLLFDEVPPLECAALGLPAALNDVLRRALSKDAAGRFQTAKAFWAAFEQACRSAGTLPSRPTAQGDASTPSSLPDGRPAADAAPTLPRRPVSHDDAVYQEIELVYWKEVTTSDDTESYVDFLQKFPDGVYAQLARRRLGKLGADPSGTWHPGPQRPPVADGSITCVRPGGDRSLPSVPVIASSPVHAATGGETTRVVAPHGPGAASPSPAAAAGAAGAVAARAPKARWGMRAALAVGTALLLVVLVQIQRRAPQQAAPTPPVLEKTLQMPSGWHARLDHWGSAHPPIAPVRATAQARTPGVAPMLSPLPRIAALAPSPRSAAARPAQQMAPPNRDVDAKPASRAPGVAVEPPGVPGRPAAPVSPAGPAEASGPPTQAAVASPAPPVTTAPSRAASREGGSELAARAASQPPATQAPPPTTAEEMYLAARAEEAAGALDKAVVWYRAAAAKNHGPAAKRMWEILSSRGGSDAEAARYQRQAYQQQVPGVPEPRRTVVPAW